MAGYCGKCNQHYNCSWWEHDEECEGITNRERLENYQRDNNLTNDEMTDFIRENNIDY